MVLAYTTPVPSSSEALQRKERPYPEEESKRKEEDSASLSFRNPYHPFHRLYHFFIIKRLLFLIFFTLHTITIRRDTYENTQSLVSISLHDSRFYKHVLVEVDESGYEDTLKPRTSCGHSRLTNFADPSRRTSIDQDLRQDRDNSLSQK